MASKNTTEADLAKDSKNDQNQTVIKPLGWAIPMYPNDVKSSNQGIAVQQMPLTHEPSATDNSPLITNTQPVALLVSSNSAPPKQVTVPPNCYLVMEKNGSMQQPINQNRASNLSTSENYYDDGFKTRRNSRLGLECLDGVEKIWIHQKVELFESKYPLYLIYFLI
ncbi:unnamed protein product [Rodentolepis nana]|uniref:Ovule protein n=1 Tax=Rodentolepis nana TaxID=102285 RepID=A0A0R3T174_RODNA|nr:unnamed protein product [Rodentolepis nana]